jgi:DNA-3-methyladenine glycosylase I
VTEAHVRGDLLDRGDDGLLRCIWGGSPEEYRTYHDAEWGRPLHDDARLFEKICLEGFQSGLSWLTILRKRDAFRQAFSEFDVETVARYTERNITTLLGNAGIVRHRGKIVSVINNAQRCIELCETDESLDSFVWRYQPSARSRPRRITQEWLMQNPFSPESTALSRDLKRRGWSFVGPTTMYAFMQSVGIVDDHQAACHVRLSANG